MNRTSSLLLVAAAAFAFFGSIPAASATTRENQRLRAGKITKTEAQHLVLQKYPGSKIKHCELIGGNKHSVIVVEFIKPGAKDTTKIRVDGESGKVSP